ncbi:MAG: type IX secretion system sortase PorU [Cyclobacteriaceae bacterium]|nr:type IX secretion system sortase PorU [Cyclobacteriaceae bacterium]
MGILHSLRRIIIVTLLIVGPVSGVLKSQTPRQLVVDITWTNEESLNITDAMYPDELAGLPLVTIKVADPDVQSVTIAQKQTTVLPDSVNIPRVDYKLISLRKIVERGVTQSWIDIIPVYFDSTENRYFKIEQLILNFTKSQSKPIGNHLRTSETDNSVLASGSWIKIPVTESGIYKLDESYLKKAGISTASINPKYIKIHGYGGGMLPQQNDAARQLDLPETAIIVSGESDGRFDKSDYILFYGQSPHRIQLLPNGELDYQVNFYSDTAYYFLTVAEEPGLRMMEKPDMGNNHPVINDFDDFITHEKEEVNIINSGREWFGEKFDFTLTYDFSYAFTDLVAGTPVSVTSSVMGQTYAEASLDLLLNGKNLGVQRINPVVEGTYLAKGSLQKDTFTMNSSDIPAAGKFTLRLSYNRAGGNTSRAYLNYFTIQARRMLKPYENQTIFRSLRSLEHALSTFEITDASGVGDVFDITDPINPARQQFAITNSKATFGSLNSGLNEYIMVKDQDYLIPGKAQKIQPQNLHGLGSVDLLIISHPSFLSEANRLADFRKSHDGLSTEVVTVDEIYNEFSSGRQDVSAIRDFIRFIYRQGSGDHRLENVLLFGRGSFDYKNRIDGNYNFVPIYSSRNSLHPINSYSSDDYYGFLDDDEGEWNESYSGDHLMDVGLGRLPVKTLEEARTIVDKLISYSSGEEAMGEWRNELVFVADDGDGNLHQRDADKLTVLVDTSFTNFNVNKIYVDAFPQVKTTSGENAPLANEAIARHIEDGSLIVNFTGHGSTTRWTSETILNLTSISEYDNKNKYPLFVTATCEFGRHDNPMVISGAEYLLLRKNAGAIGLVTTSRPVFSSTNFILNRAFYNHALKKVNGSYLTLGEIFRKTKNESLNGSVNRNFSLLGDPSMTLAYAHDEIKLLAGDNYLVPGDTLKALGTVKMKGQVIDAEGKVNTSFEGTAVATVFDVPTVITTLGNEDPPMNFALRDNLLFKGEATVAHGEFEFEFIVPKDISYDFKKGKISIYAYDSLKSRDAAGSTIEFVIGGDSEDYLTDNTPPVMQLFINDTTFTPGTITGPDIIFLAHLNDESGIGISKSEEGKDLQLSIDGGEWINVSRYYKAAKDTYMDGWVTYPVKELSIGTHTATLGVRDVHNNYSEAEIEFVVVDGQSLTIDNLMNYPNPFSDQTILSFQHNHAGDDLAIGVYLYSSMGALVKQFNYIEENSPSRISYLVWDEADEQGSKLRSGIYILNLMVESLSDGSKNMSNHKLVIIK